MGDIHESLVVAQSPFVSRLIVRSGQESEARDSRYFGPPANEL